MPSLKNIIVHEEEGGGGATTCETIYYNEYLVLLDRLY